MPLTDTMLRNLKPDGTPTKLADSEGLYLYLSPTGSKLWRMDYRFSGKRKTLSFGAYPIVSLKDARGKRDNAKELLAKDMDPGAHKKATKAAAAAIAKEQALTFAVVARELFETKKDVYAASNVKKKQWLIDFFDDKFIYWNFFGSQCCHCKIYRSEVGGKCAGGCSYSDCRGTYQRCFCYDIWTTNCKARTYADGNTGRCD